MYTYTYTYIYVYTSICKCVYPSFYLYVYTLLLVVVVMVYALVFRLLRKSGSVVQHQSITTLNIKDIYMSYWSSWGYSFAEGAMWFDFRLHWRVPEFELLQLTLCCNALKINLNYGFDWPCSHWGTPLRPYLVNVMRTLSPWLQWLDTWSRLGQWESYLRVFYIIIDPFSLWLLTLLAWSYWWLSCQR